jgi:hypothetical protein
MAQYRDFQEDSVIGEGPSSQILIETDADGRLRYANDTV